MEVVLIVPCACGFLLLGRGLHFSFTCQFRKLGTVAMLAMTHRRTVLHPVSVLEVENLPEVKC